MRLVPIASTGLLLALIAGGASITAVAAGRESSFSTQAASLQRQWDADIVAGVPPSSIKPLRTALAASSDDRSTWWSPHWWGATGQSLVQQLTQETTTVWNAALSARRTEAQSAVDQWHQLTQDLGSYVPDSASAQAATWPQQLAAATTPAQLQRLSRSWLTLVSTARTEAQAAQLNSEVSGYGGIAGLLDQAARTLNEARSDALDVGNVPQLIEQVRSQFDSGGNPATLVKQLVDGVQSLHSLISLNNKIGGEIRPVQWATWQAAAEGTPNASSFQSQASSLQSAYHNATTMDQLSALQNTITALQTSINNELAAHVCGHDVGSGKVITISLSLQEGVFYQDGCVVKATPVTTGRPALPTPAGHFSVFYKTSPFEMISPWPKPSPYWYPDTWVNRVMEFAGGGYFLHDADWEPLSDYGPGGQYSGGASHGCIHIPDDVMPWLYDWTPMGAPVIISN
ncbi:MAG: L,D-transpeptidase family protein [Candidatus Dormibacteria bacterium]